jgi:hypothetical protein
VKAARDRGIYVSIMFFEGWGLQFESTYRWTRHPFNSSNNINSVNGDTNSDGYGYEIHQNSIAAVNTIQEAYVKKVIDTVNVYDNVLYEICNEDGGGTMAWQEHIVDIIQAYEATKPYQHPVGITPRWDGSTARSVIENEVFASSADWVSPAETGWRSNPPTDNEDKVVMSDTDHLW